MKKRSFLLLILILSFFVSNTTFSQSPTNLDKAVLYTKEKAFYLVLHSEGWGIGYRKGKHLAFNKTQLFEGEIVDMSHPKETKTENPYFGDAHTFVYGQLNSVYIIRGGTGFKKMLNDKPYWGGVQLSYIYFGGVSLGLARPKYLYIINQVPYSNEFFLTLERYDPNKHFLDDNIYGGGPLFKGFESLKPYPGLYGKFGFNFEFGEYDEKIRAIEVGTIFDYYFAKIPMMAANKYPNYFLTFYINIQFGKRYNLY
ncbi:MAG: hypothetical protein NTZ33_07365 [Bacteroidetes bacterium]|nr:hypothetical protein [Bacteroidota bacterium]